MKKILFGNIILPTILLWGVAVAADTSLSASERDFVQKILQGSVSEVGLGRLARSLRETVSPRVDPLRRFVRIKSTVFTLLIHGITHAL